MVELDGAGGYEPGEILRQSTIALTPKQFAELRQLIEREGFWKLPTIEKNFGHDGSRWIIEGVDGKYHAVDRWTPRDGPVRAIGEKFIALSGWKFAARDLY